MDDPRILKDPDTEETFVSCPMCERVTSIIDMVDQLGCACAELMVFVDGNSIILVPTANCPSA